MTSTSTDFKPTVEDFDQWTEKNDEEAFASIAQNYKVRHIIKGDVIGRSCQADARTSSHCR